MRGRRAVALAWGLALLVSPWSAAAEAPATPTPRPTAQAASVQAAFAVRQTPAPVVRDPSQPRPRPEIETLAPTPAFFGRNRGPKLCGVRGLEGARIEPIRGQMRGCGLSDGVEVRAVDGVRLSQPAWIDCPTARALQTWVRKGVVPAIDGRGGGLVELEVVGHYVCRTRNHQRGAKISEHGKGRAIDIAGFRLASGGYLDVRRGWRHPEAGPILKQIHRAACGPFGTVLGPNADRFHQSHFHLDTARHRSGAFCR